MINLSSLSDQLNSLGLTKWSELIPSFVEKVLQHGDTKRWQNHLNQLPDLKTEHWNLAADCIEIGVTGELDNEQKKQLRDQLLNLQPWRKGPFNVFGIHVDCEWRSDWKWNRLVNDITTLDGRMVLDVGCGNGYYALKMLGQGAKAVVGVEPHALFHAQYIALARYLPSLQLAMLPCTLEDLPGVDIFDSVFSLGVIYHRRSPLDHLSRLKDCLRPGGQLVLESLIIDGDKDSILEPAGRYARMRNVWCIPSPESLLSWLERSRFHDARIVDVTTTTIEEQRQTQWMQFESLAQCLDSNNADRTVEGFPAPRRAILIAEK